MRIVIKVGTSTLTHKTGNLNIHRVEEMCKVISDIANAGHELILVSSGAIAMGVGKMGLPNRPQDIPGKQAAAAVGQCELMYVYDKLFSEYNHNIAQILITDDDFRSEKRYTNFTNTMTRLLELGCIPVLNENDTVSTEEIALGDNDTLAAIVACAVGAHVLIVLSDIDGLYTADPRKDKTAKLIPVVEEITPDIESLASGEGSAFGTGGMVTKINAAKTCTENGCCMIIANGNNPNNLYSIMNGRAVGTKFLAQQTVKMRQAANIQQDVSFAQADNNQQTIQTRQSANTQQTVDRELQAEGVRTAGTHPKPSTRRANVRTKQKKSHTNDDYSRSAHGKQDQQSFGAHSIRR